MADAIFFGTYVLLWACTAFAVTGVIGLYGHTAQQQARTREGRASMGPAIGEPLPGHLRNDVREAMNATASSVGLIGFVSTSCRPCEALKPVLLDALKRRREVSCLLYCQGPSEDIVAAWGELFRGHVQLRYDSAADHGNRAGISITPFFLGVVQDLTVASKGILNDSDAIEQFLLDCERFPAARPLVGVGLRR